MFLRDRGGSLFVIGGESRALDEWREAARLVSARWAAFLEAGQESRAWAFASYVAALDAEEAAAAGLARVPMRAAA